MNFIQTNNAPAAIGPYSQAVEINGMIYTSGQIALKPDGSFINGSVKEQAGQVLENLKQVLLASGSEPNKVVKSTIFFSKYG